MSAGMVQFEAASAPAFVLWRWHLFPYVDRYVRAGLFEAGEYPVMDGLRGKPIEAVCERFGAKAKLLDEHWDDRLKMRVERFELSRPTGFFFIMHDGKCVEMQTPGA